MLDSNKARDALKDIVNTKEYQIYYNESRGFLQLWWEKAKEWIASQLEKLFPALDSTSSISGVILMIIIVIALFLLLLSANILIRNMRKNKFRKQKPLQTLKEMNWSFQRHLEEAEKLESLAEYSQSTRHLFLALLLYFHDKGWLEARIWKTNWDYYDELRKINQDHADQFFHLAHFFDEVSYGERQVQLEEYVPFRDEIRKLLNEKGEDGVQ